MHVIDVMYLSITLWLPMSEEEDTCMS